ncbi:hypothetical protein FA15DRAFT_698416 [Coprinopsis marcescibilis]|uniref:RNI-like protein n=1 Tax=Coprinopsis marcescibilis TaxID=230819 RepID=A0A5C3KCX8_COPMA|nr:hypothetical protein FA15DRAFT_698416 [Coprinopsis marcescibilis]
MGERHQALLIGRVSRRDGTSRYRCIAALHDWCDGETPIRNAHRFSLIAKQPDNASLIREELQNYPENVEKLPKAPCPYALSLLEMAWTAHESKRGVVRHANHLEVDCMQNESLWSCIDCTSGVTVIDVTDPQNLAICFVLSDEPLSSKQYLLWGDDSDADEDDEDWVEAFRLLDRIPIISLDVLAETFPMDFNPLISSGEPVSDPDKPNHTVELPTLATLALNQAVHHAVENDQLGLLEHVFDVPGKLQSVLLQLKKSPKFPSNAAAFFSKAFRTLPINSKELDLSGYNFSGKQVVEVIGDLDAVETLNLSHNTIIDKNGLYEILLHLRNLRHLNISSTSLSNDDLRSLRQDHHPLFSRLHHVFHPFFISARDPSPNPFTVQIELVGQLYSSCWGRRISYWIPFINANSLPGKFTDLFEQLTVRANGLHTPESGIRVILASGMETLHGPAPAEEWSHRRISTFPRKGVAETWRKEGYVLILRGAEEQGTYGTAWEYGIFSCRPKNVFAAEVESQQEKDCLVQDQEHYVQEVLDFGTFFKRLESEGYAVDQGKLQLLLDTVQTHPRLKLSTLEGCLATLARRDWDCWRYVRQCQSVVKRAGDGLLSQQVSLLATLRTPAQLDDCFAQVAGESMGRSNQPFFLLRPSDKHVPGRRGDMDPVRKE